MAGVPGQHRRAVCAVIYLAQTITAADASSASGAAAPTAWPRNGADASYPWSFSGRFWFRPALVRAPPEDALPDGVSAVAALGWTLGGVVTLEYDESPVGAYREYVTMGALVTKRGAVGQWGSRLCVSTPTAEAVCR